jgi:hypothetical protein
MTDRAFGVGPYDNSEAEELLRKVTRPAVQEVDNYLKGPTTRRHTDRAVASAQLLCDLGFWPLSSKDTERFFSGVREDDDNRMGWGEPKARRSAMKKLEEEVWRAFF